MEVERSVRPMATSDLMPSTGLLSMRMKSGAAQVCGPQPRKGLAGGLHRLLGQSVPTDIPAYRSPGSEEVEIQSIMLKKSPSGSPGTLRATLGFSPPTRTGNPMVNDSAWRSSVHVVSYSNLAELEARGVDRSPLRAAMVQGSSDNLWGLQFEDGDFSN